jgi:hypothetical protein
MQNGYASGHLHSQNIWLNPLGYWTSYGQDTKCQRHGENRIERLHMMFIFERDEAPFEFKRLCGAYKGLVQVQRYRRLTANHLLGALDIAEAMSVREKSLPLKSSGKFGNPAIAYEKQSPKFKAAACLPFPYFKKAAIAI